MAYNFLGLVNDINRRLNEVELTQANFSSAVGFYASAKDAVNASIREINQAQFEWPFNHTTREDTLVPGQVRYSIQANTKTLDMDSFRLKRDDALGNETLKLRLISYEEYLDKYLDYEYNTDTGIRTIPRHVFRTPSLEYGVVPSPDKAYTVAYEYYSNPASLSAYSDVPTIPEEFRYVIVDGAMVHAHNFRGDNESAELSRRAFQDGMKSLRSLYINRYEYVRSTVREY
jgi:hypothetical protein